MSQPVSALSEVNDCQPTDLMMLVRSGANKKIPLSRLRTGPAIYPQAFGAICDGDPGNADADTGGLQAAIDSIGDTSMLRPLEVLVSGILCLNDTIVIDKKSCWLHGNGLGNATSGQGSALRWVGSAAKPMVKITNSFNAGVTDLRFIGDHAAKPSAAINLFEGTDLVNVRPFVRNVGIGYDYLDPTGGTGAKSSGQFETGILLDGTNANNSEGLFEFIHINGCSVAGVYVSKTQNGDQLWNNLYLEQCVIAMKNASSGQVGANWFCGNNDVDMEMAELGTDLTLVGYTSEGGGRMLVFSSAKGGRVHILNGKFQAGANLNSDGFFVDSGGVQNEYISLTLDNFKYTEVSPPTTGQIRIRGNCGQSLHVRGCTGLKAANLAITPTNDADPNSGRMVTFEGVDENGLLPFFGRNFLSYPDTVDLTRFDTQKDLRVRGKLGIGIIPADVDAGLRIVGAGLKVEPLATPSAPTLQTAGAPGATSYTYYLVAVDRAGNKTLAHAGTTITTGNAVLDTDNYINIIITSIPAGVDHYDILKGNTSAYLGSTDPIGPPGGRSFVVFADQGQATDSYTAPTRNSTADVMLTGLPSADPHVVGKLWANSGVVTVSAG